MMANCEIHSTAIVEKGAEIGAGVKIGLYCLIGAEVLIGDRCTLTSHVVVTGRTVIGAGTQIFPFASIGHRPQDLKYQGEKSTLTIGADCIIREGVTINPGTAGGGMVTTIGDHCAFLANSHVGHDCQVGNNVIFSNNVMLAGHCVLGGGAAVIQFTRIGAHAFLGGMSALVNDLIPYGMAIGNRARLSGLNIVGLQRRGYARSDIHDLRRAHRLLFADEGALVERVDDVADEFTKHPIVQEIVSFIRAGGKRSLCTPHEGACRVEHQRHLAATAKTVKASG